MRNREREMDKETDWERETEKQRTEHGYRKQRYVLKKWICKGKKQ